MSLYDIRTQCLYELKISESTPSSMVRAPSLYLGGSWFESKGVDSEIIHISGWLGVRVPPGVYET